MSRTEPTMGLHICSNVPNHLQASTQDNGRLRWAAPLLYIVDTVALTHRDVSSSKCGTIGNLTGHQDPK